MRSTLFLAEKYPPSIGGSCNMFASRFGLFPPEKIRVLAGAVSGDREFDSAQGYRIDRIPVAWKGPKGFEWLGVVRQFVRGGLFRMRGISVIECARPLPEGVAGCVLAFLFRRKLIINFHGEDISVLGHYRVERWILKRIIRRAHLNLANSRFTEKLIIAIGGPRSRTAVVHPGFNPAFLGIPDPARVAALRERFGKGPILVTVGRIQKRKGQDNVIRALPSLVARFPDLRYLVVGSSQGGTDGLDAQLRALAESLGVGAHVAILGEVAGEGLADFFSLADIFVMPNRVEGAGDVEGFGIVFLEAGWLGKPVIGGDSGGVPDAVLHGETGLLVDGHSVTDISGALASLLADPDRARALGEQGRRVAAGRTSPHVFSDYVRTVAAARL